MSASFVMTASGAIESIVMRTLRKDAARGDAHAQHRLAVALHNGNECEQDFERAFEFFAQAAAQGLADAECSLGICFEHGEGVRQSDVEAARCYRRSAEHGNCGGMNNWAACLAQGGAVQVDPGFLRLTPRLLSSVETKT